MKLPCRSGWLAMQQRDEVDELPQWTRGLFRECGVTVATTALALPLQHPTALRVQPAILGGRVCFAWQVVFEARETGEGVPGRRYMFVHSTPLRPKATALQPLPIAVTVRLYSKRYLPTPWHCTTFARTAQTWFSSAPSPPLRWHFAPPSSRLVRPAAARRRR